MEYNKIVAVTGLSGLYELVSSKADGGIVRSLEDQSSKFVSNRVHNFSHLESIEIYTSNENVNLAEIFAAMQASKESRPDAKADNKALKAYFEKVYPTMDFERVYASDMKKMVKWLDILSKAGIEIKVAEPGEADENTAEEKPAVAEKKTAKTAAAKNTAAPKSNAPAKKINAPRKMA
ncbi:MAG TPA: DUF5606 domain-containing protein [Ferruginibacter sp.]|nr:DUF5606 domain-containing protein [Ferruginibacter sp.]HRE62661.1 DUF5606 domain-containing protein [Ferruginibacter sp.]